jgi:hypothetical protein
MHSGLDLVTRRSDEIRQQATEGGAPNVPGPNLGESVMATLAGKVVRAGWSGGFGKAVVIDAGNGLLAISGHLQELSPGIKEGAAVKVGEPLGIEGHTGRATGDHVHYELRVVDEHGHQFTVDPLDATRTQEISSDDPLHDIRSSRARVPSGNQASLGCIRTQIQNSLIAHDQTAK